MDRRERQENLETVQRILDSQEWKFLKAEILRLSEGKSLELDSLMSKGLIYESQYCAGFIKGLNYVLGIPERVRRDNTTYFERLKEAVGL